MQNRSSQHQADAPQRKKIKNTTTFLIAGLGNTLSHIFFHPVNTIISRVQIHKKHIETFQEFKSIIFSDAVNHHPFRKMNSLYKGFFISGTYKLITRTFKYGGQPILAEQINTIANASSNKWFKSNSGVVIQNALAGGTIGILEAIMFYPIDTIRIKLQNGDKRAVKQIYKEEKINLYNGVSITAVRNFSNLFILFGVTAWATYLFGVQERRQLSLPQFFVAALTGSTASTFVTSPLDNLKTRVQTSNGKISVFSVFKQIVREEGIPALYRGLSLKILLSLPKKALPLALSRYLLEAYEKLPFNPR